MKALVAEQAYPAAPRLRQCFGLERLEVLDSDVRGALDDCGGRSGSQHDEQAQDRNRDRGRFPLISRSRRCGRTLFFGPSPPFQQCAPHVVTSQKAG